MKKLSFALALLLALSCCLLASCGGDGDESSVASSTATSSATTSSKAESSAAGSSEEVSSEDASSEEASSEEVSSEDASSEEVSSEDTSSEDAGFVKNPDALPTEGENVALGKSYVVSEQYRQNSEWKYDETCDVVYPDDGVELTDGAVPDDSNYQADGWAGFNVNTPAQTARGYAYITVDLDEVYEFSTVGISLYAQADVGIGYPTTVGVAVSEDGENFTDVVTANVDIDGDGVGVVNVDCDATGRYVQVKLSGGTWNFVGEIEVK